MRTAISNARPNGLLTGGADFPPGRTMAVSRNRPLRFPVGLKWMFLVFVVSVVFEDYDVAGVAHVLSISKATGLMLFLAALAHKRYCFTELPRPFVLFVIPGLFMVAHCFSNLSLLLPSVVSTLTYLQMTVMFLICSNILRNDRILRNCLFALIFSITLLAVLSRLGITGTERSLMVATETGVNQAVERESAFGVDENYIGMVYGLGALCCLGVISQRLQLFAFLKVMLWPAFAINAWSMVGTGSRGAMASFGVSTLALVFMSSTGAKKAVRLFRAVAVVGVLAVLVWKMVMSSTVAVDRWTNTLEQGDTAARNVIWSAALKQARDTWLFGDGIPMAYLDLGRRITGFNKEVGPHNEFLNMLLIAGVAGALGALGGWYYCVKGAWRARATPLGLISFAAVVFALTMSNDVAVYHRKIFWLTLAMAYAAGRMEPSKTMPARANPTRWRSGRSLPNMPQDRLRGQEREEPLGANGRIGSQARPAGGSV